MTLIQQADDTIEASRAELVRASAEDKRQRNLLQTQLAGTEQLVEQADANARKAEATVLLNRAQLEQQKLVLSQLDIEEKQLAAQAKAAQAQVDLARNSLGYTRIVSPVDGSPSEVVGSGQSEGDADDQSARGERRTRYRGCFPFPGVDRPCGELVARDGLDFHVAAAR
jgi:multidrug efflux pump subunit AcrA (membrane-fusion protein)